MRQVINKLITEEDLYAAVDSAYSQGWRRMKLYFLTGLPTETDEDTLGIADAGPQLRRDRPQAHQGRVGHRVGRRLRAQAVHAVPVVRPEHRRRSSAARSTCCATRCGANAGVQLKWHDPKATLAEGIASRGDRRIGAVIETCGAAAAPSRSGPSTSTSTSGSSAMAEHGLSRRVVRLPPPHRGRGAAVGPHLGRPPQGLPVAGLARRARPSSASRTAGGRPATTAAPAPATASSTSSPRPCRRPAAARAPARTWRAARSAGRAHPQARGERDVKVRLRFSKLGKVRFTSHRDVARIWERALRRAAHPAWPTPRGSPPAPGCASGWRCPPATSRWASTSTSTSRRTGAVDVDAAPCPARLGPARRPRRAGGGRGRARHPVAAAGRRPAARGGSR